MNEKSQAKYAGIDVSKGRLDVAVGVEGEYENWSVGNDEKGIAELVERLKAEKPEQIVLESTGGLEVRAMRALDQAGMAVALTNPGRVRDFARSIGLLAKTDPLDAGLLKRFGEAVKPRRTRMADEAEQQLAERVMRRRQVLEMIVAERNRQEGATGLKMKALLEGHIRWLQEAQAE